MTFRPYPVGARCSECDHPFGWHDDRALAACDGGYQSVTSIRRHTPQGPNGYRPVSLCGCTGWRVDPS